MANWLLRLLKSLYSRLILSFYRRKCRECEFFKEIPDYDMALFKGWEGRCSGKVEAFYIRTKPNNDACKRFLKRRDD